MSSGTFREGEGLLVWDGLGWVVGERGENV